MRHRIVTGTGFGNPDPVLLDNTGDLDTDFGTEALGAYFDYFGGFDYKVTKTGVTIGYEPAYQYERLRIIHIDKDINKSYIQNGKAWGPYGSGIAKTTKYYSEYKRKCKFKNFIDRWHSGLFGGE